MIALAGVASLMLALSATAAPHASIKIVLPKHILVGKRIVIELTGDAAGFKPEVSLYSQPQKCRSSFTAENKFRNPTIFVDGGHVKGHYVYKDPADFAQGTHKSLYFCAYLTSFTPSFSYITQAHASVRFHVPS